MTLQIEADIYSKEMIGDDVVVTLGESKLTLRDTSSLSTINIRDKEILIFTNDGATKQTLTSNFINTDATAHTKSSRTVDNGTLSGGAGNDSLWGGNGADLFIYTAGKDIIADFDSNDSLQIMEIFSAQYNPSKNTIAFKVSSTAKTPLPSGLHGDDFQHKRQRVSNRR